MNKFCLMHLCEVRSECDGVWPFPARHVINTKLAKHVTRRVTDESEASFHATASKRQDASRATPTGKEWSRLSG